MVPAAPEERRGPAGNCGPAPLTCHG